MQNSDENELTMSHPAWGEWIEICSTSTSSVSFKSHPAWGEWIEIQSLPFVAYMRESHPAWGEWIEILRPLLPGSTGKVSPRMG